MILLVLEQTLNGLQYGVMLLLMAAGLTLVFGIMNLVNLAHGSLYMVGAYLATGFYQWTGSFLASVALALAATLVVGIVVEVVALRTLYERDHLDQVLATFGLVLFVNELIAIVWGRAALYSSLPGWLSGHMQVLPGVRYPVYRALVIIVGLVVAALLYLMVTRTRLGMLIRAGASNRTMVAALGVNIRLLYTVVFGFGAALAGLAGLMAGPIYAVQPGMGEQILIQVFVVIVIGGIGSIRGALVGAILVGMVDTLGRAFLRPLLSTIVSPNAADAPGPPLASILIYVLMAAGLFFGTQGSWTVRPGRGMARAGPTTVRGRRSRRSSSRSRCSVGSAGRAARSPAPWRSTRRRRPGSCAGSACRGGRAWSRRPRCSATSTRRWGTCCTST